MIIPQSVRAWTASRSWIRDDVVLPFVFTRFALVIGGWFAQYFPLNAHYPSAIAATRGWHFSAHRLVDIWGRWDAGWYLSIVFDGYKVRGDIQTTQSNIAFFPMYPYLVKSLVQLVPAQYRTLGTALFIGVVLSNVLLLGAMILLRELVALLIQDEAAARRSVLYMLVFPTSFFFSCFYTESLFLFLSVAAFYAARKQAWAAAGLIGALLALTRPIGVLIVIPLLWVYLESHGWKFRTIRLHIAWLVLVPLGLLTYLLGIYHLTGNLLAPLQIQTAWGKALVAPWHTLLNPRHFSTYVTPVEQVFVVAFVLLGLASARLLPSVGYTLYTLLLLSPPFVSGTLQSVLRYYAVVFPIFIVIALLAKRQTLDRFVTITFLALQVLFMAAWSQFYWVG